MADSQLLDLPFACLRDVGPHEVRPFAWVLCTARHCGCHVQDDDAHFISCTQDGTSVPTLFLVQLGVADHVPLGQFTGMKRVWKGFSAAQCRKSEHERQNHTLEEATHDILVGFSQIACRIPLVPGCICNFGHSPVVDLRFSTRMAFHVNRCNGGSTRQTHPPGTCLCCRCSGGL